MQTQLKVTLPPAVAEALRLEAIKQDRSMSYVVAALLIAHFETSEQPPRAGRPVPLPAAAPEVANRADNLVNPDVADAAKSVASSIADKYFTKAKRRR